MLKIPSQIVFQARFTHCSLSDKDDLVCTILDFSDMQPVLGNNMAPLQQIHNYINASHEMEEGSDAHFKRHGD